MSQTIHYSSLTGDVFNCTSFWFSFPKLLRAADHSQSSLSLMFLSSMLIELTKEHFDVFSTWIISDSHSSFIFRILFCISYPCNVDRN